MPAQIPSNTQLADLIDRLTREWAGTPARHAGWPAPGPAQMDHEYSVSFTGPHLLRWVVRGGHDLAQELAERSTGDANARALAADAFREFVNLLAECWLLGDPLEFPGPWHCTLSEPSSPDSWPLGEPESAVVVMVDRYPLELRLWLVDRPVFGDEGAKNAA